MSRQDSGYWTVGLLFVPKSNLGVPVGGGFSRCSPPCLLCGAELQGAVGGREGTGVVPSGLQVWSSSEVRKAGSQVPLTHVHILMTGAPWRGSCETRRVYWG